MQLADSQSGQGPRFTHRRKTSEQDRTRPEAFRIFSLLDLDGRDAFELLLDVLRVFLADAFL